MSIVLECPVCGREPKMKHKDKHGEYIVYIACRPLFGKLHEQALAYGSYEMAAYKDAIHLWNARVRAYKERQRDVGN